MHVLYFILWSSSFSYVTAASKPSDPCYIGSVVEFNKGGRDLEENLLNYVYFIENASEQQADIIIFPEMGLYNNYEEAIFPVPDPKDGVVPRIDNNQNKVMKILSKAAFENKIYVVVNIIEKYISGSSSMKYNTNVVFDRNGTVVARYRKFNLFGPELQHLNKTDSPEYSYFETDFGVKFGTFTCFDILFYHPSLELVYKYGVTDIAFPTAWFSQLPFLTAIQEQASWSYGLGVNLLASGLNNVKKGSSGSGIYGGADGPIAYWLSEEDGSKLLIQTIKKKENNNGHITPYIPNGFSKLNEQDAMNQSDAIDSKGQVKGKGLKIIVEDLQLFETNLLTPSEGYLMEEDHDEKKKLKFKNLSFEKIICQRTLCCQFSVNVTMEFGPTKFAPNRRDAKGDEFEFYRYRFMVFDGVRSFSGSATGGVQACGIISCLSENVSTCGLKAGSEEVQPALIEDPDYGSLELYKTKFTGIQISGSFNGNYSFVAPNSLKTGPSGLFGAPPDHKEMNFTKFQIESGKVNASLLLTQPKNSIRLVTAAIYARLFERDGLPVSKPAHSLSPSFTPIYSLIIFISIILTWRMRSGANLFQFFFS